ncbi:MAG: AI-2E family transporter [Tepidisphaeraceae bacterium]
MARPVAAVKTSRFVLLASVCVVVAALHFARDVLVPVALSLILTFLLTPLALRLERRGLGRVISVLLVVVLSFGPIAVLGYLVFNQVLALGENLETYKVNIRAKLDWLPKAGQGGMIEQFQQAVTELSEEAARPATTQSTQSTQQAEGSTTQPALAVIPPEGLPQPPPQNVPTIPASEATTKPVATAIGPSRPGPPLPVTIVPAAPSPLDLLGDNISLVAGPLGTAGIVAVFVIFMLLSREDLRDRLIRLTGYGQWTLTTQAMDDAASRISRYLVAQAIVNGSYGVAISIGLWLIGRFVGDSAPPFPNVILWGLLCALLRFIPYIGPWIAAAMPLVLALAVYKGVGVFVATVTMFVVIELISNNIMEPLLYGSSTGMSTVAILVSAVFWTWLWGPIGLLMATPLTVCLIVLGKYVPQLQFLDIMLGDEPVLAPHERLYQRWLALDPEEAGDVVVEFFKTRSLEEMYDTVLLPAVALAEIDRHNGRLDDQRQAMIRQSTRALIDELGDEFRLRFARTGATTAEVPSDAKAEASAPATPARRVPLDKQCAINALILPSHDEADEIVALMLAQLLEFNNYCGHAGSIHTLAGEMTEMVHSKQADIVCVSALPPSAVTHARYLCKRLHQKHPELKMVVGLWTIKGDLARARERISCSDSVQLVTTLAGALDQIVEQTKANVVKQREAAKTESTV